MCARINGCGKCAPITRARDSEKKKDEKTSKNFFILKNLGAIHACYVFFFRD